MSTELQDFNPARHTPLILGTVQLGMPYGVANRSGMPDLQEASAIIEAALQGGITTFDTAAAYGNSERVLGEVLTRLHPGQEIQLITKFSAEEGDPIQQLECSLSRLQTTHLYCAMFHREQELSLLDSSVGTALQPLTKSGRIRHIGVSVYSPESARRAILHPQIDIVQLPASLLDRRFKAAGIFELAEEHHTELHIRSIFLQGVLTMHPKELPPHLAPFAPVLQQLAEVCHQYDITPQTAAMGWIQTHCPHARLLFGAETAEQVQENLLSATTALPPELLTALHDLQPPQEEQLLNPSLWKRP